MATGKRFPDTFANPHKNAIANNCFSPAESRCLGTGLPFKSYKDKGKVLASIAIECNKYRKHFLLTLLVYFLIYSVFSTLIFIETPLISLVLSQQNQ
jgi:hypothetical protein